MEIKMTFVLLTTIILLIFAAEFNCCTKISKDQMKDIDRVSNEIGTRRLCEDSCPTNTRGIRGMGLTPLGDTDVVRYSQFDPTIECRGNAGLAAVGQQGTIDCTSSNGGAGTVIRVPGGNTGSAINQPGRPVVIECTSGGWVIKATGQIIDSLACIA